MRVEGIQHADPSRPPEPGPGLGSPALSIAVLLNSYRSPFIAAIRDSYVRAIGSVSPESRLAFFYPVERDGDFPDPREFDLIVVGGGNLDPRRDSSCIRSVHDFIRETVRAHPGKKLCGICWGHQTIARVFGGVVADMEVPELGVTEVALTAAGHKFFPAPAGRAFLRVQQHHRREVAVAPAGFVELARGRQCLLNWGNTILTFQGHPEKDAETAKLRLADSERWFGTCLGDEVALEKLRGSMEVEHDGRWIWERVLQWARE
ncbi:Class I glutamine amidotransferase-like protein [Pleurostoma richardsiae]|uniref:Class I glutamine amidotransferase-like protein n=1 Tax=Pleurostoma richardsiae TaxID=41990 RepID=A0AA38VJG5_9PEZI|nr:Class I glutamine amidotransferase-like protein [Pleurostoma richardsiae]